jgi:hypothetical protein
MLKAQDIQFGADFAGLELSLVFIALSCCESPPLAGTASRPVVRLAGLEVRRA